MSSTPRTMSNFGIVTRIAIFLAILLVSGLIIPFNYMASNVVFFVALLAFVIFGFKNLQGRNLLLLLYAHLLVFVSAINVAVVVPAVRQFAADGFPLAPQVGAVLIAMLIALVVTFFVVTIPFLLTITLLPIVELNWYKAKAWLSYIFGYGLSILGLSSFSVVIENGEKKGSEEDIKRLDTFGGPGWLIVYPRYVVVLHQHGEMTRAIGPGLVLLKRAEKIKTILPLGKVGNVQTIENVLTRDQIPLEITLLHVAQLESAAETKARHQRELADAKANQDKLQKDANASTEDKTAAKEAVDKAEKRLKALEIDTIIDDGFDTCYASVAKIAATKTADVWGMFKAGIALNLKDVMLSVYAEELFSIDEGDNKLELKDKITQRKITEIEQILTNKVKDSKLNDGVKLIVLDILQIEFPKQLQKSINEASDSQNVLLEYNILTGLDSEKLELLLEFKEKILENDKLSRALRDFINTVDNIQEVESIIAQRGVKYLVNKVNPYIAGDPIHNPQLFFGREELITKILQGIFRNHIAIQGPRRSGKSSLLIQLAQQLKNLDSTEIHFVPVLFDCHETTETDFFYDLMDAVLTTLLKLDPKLSLPTLTFQSQNVGYNNRHFKKDIELILTTLAKRLAKKVRIILLLDEGDALNEYSSATQRKIRNLISQHRAIKMIWAGTNILTATDDPTSPWYNMQLTYELASLSESEARTLITQPVVELGYTYQSEAIQRILERANGQPYIIQYLCYRAVETMLAAQRVTIILADVETAITQLNAEKSAKDPDSVVYQSRQKIEAKLTLAEKPEAYQPEKKDD